MSPVQATSNKRRVPPQKENLSHLKEIGALKVLFLFISQDSHILSDPKFFLLTIAPLIKMKHSMVLTQKKCLLIVNFGGPRTLDEVEPFLRELLTDQEVVRTSWPPLIHRVLFGRIAKKRARKVAPDYKKIGGRSPIFFDTEAIAKKLRGLIDTPIFTFHRYLPATHNDFIEEFSQDGWEEITIFPLFPQFTYATSGSVAHWFDRHLPQKITTKMRWIKSYADHPAFINAYRRQVQEFLEKHQLPEEKVFFLFTAHGIPKEFVEKGDVYQSECERSFQELMRCFPGGVGKLAYQSKFGPGEWLRPYTIDLSNEIKKWCEGRKHVLFIPIAFTSDHIETLFEIENEYLPPVRAQGFSAYRLPALNLCPNWIKGITEILASSDLLANQMLIRHY